jgi:hypothetical protein
MVVASLIKKIINPILFIFGLFVCLFDTYFLITGIDEIWNGHKIWLYGFGIVGLIGSIGISAIIISLNNKKRVPLIFFISSIIFLILTIVGFFIS